MTWSIWPDPRSRYAGEDDLACRVEAAIAMRFRSRRDAGQSRDVRDMRERIAAKRHGRDLDLKQVRVGPGGSGKSNPVPAWLTRRTTLRL